MLSETRLAAEDLTRTTTVRACFNVTSGMLQYTICGPTLLQLELVKKRLGLLYPQSHVSLPQCSCSLLRFTGSEIHITIVCIRRYLNHPRKHCTCTTLALLVLCYQMASFPDNLHLSFHS